MNQAVDPLLQLHKGAEVGEIPHAAFHAGSNRVALFDEVPGVGLGLAHPEGDPLVGSVHVEDDHLDHVADGHDLGRMLHPLSPGHLRDVH